MIRNFILLQFIVLSLALAETKPPQDNTNVWKSKVEAEKKRIQICQGVAQDYTKKAQDYVKTHAWGIRDREYTASHYFDRVNLELERANSQVGFVEDLISRLKEYEFEQDLKEDSIHDIETQIFLLNKRVDYACTLISLWKEYETGKYNVNSEGQCYIHRTPFTINPSEFNAWVHLAELVNKENQPKPEIIPVTLNQNKTKRKESEFTLDDEVPQATPVITSEVKKKKKKLLEKVKKDFEIKIDLPKVEVKPIKTFRRIVHGNSAEQQKLNAQMQSIIEKTASDVERGIYSISPELANMGKLLVLSEVEDLDIPESQRVMERQEQVSQWNDIVKRGKNLYQSTKALPINERIAKLMAQANLEFTRRYVPRKIDPNAIFMTQCMNEHEHCNCIGNSKFNASYLLAILEGEEIPKEKQILMQDEGFHIAIDLYNSKENSIWDVLAGGSRTKDLAGNFYHPAEFLNTELKRKGAKGIDHDRLLVMKGRQENTEEEKKQLALLKPRSSKIVPQFEDGLPGNVHLQSLSELIEPTKTDFQFSAPYRNQLLNAEVTRVTPQAPPVDYDQARRDLRAILDSPEFKELFKLKQNPILLASGQYDELKISRLKDLESSIYHIFSGSSYVTDPNQYDEIWNLRYLLWQQNPELRAYYELLDKEREPLKKKDREKDVEVKKYFDLFKVLGPKNWKLYKRLQDPLRRDSHDDEASHLNYLQETGNQPLFSIHSVYDLDSYFINPEKVSFMSQYRTKTKEKESQHKTGQTQVKTTTGFRKKLQGTKFKPEQKGLIELSPIDFAHFIQQAGSPLADEVSVYERWTPALTAALREAKDYDKDFVDWFTKRGYRDVADSRDPKSLMIVGPDKKSIPKDIAVLLIDMIQNKDGTAADKEDLKKIITQNYGSVQKYLKVVREDFAKPPSVHSANEEQIVACSELKEVGQMCKTSKGKCFRMVRDGAFGIGIQEMSAFGEKDSKDCS